MRLPLLIVVPRNDEYCILKSFAVLEQTPGVPGLDIPGIDVVSIAKGYGCNAARLELEAIKRAAVEAWSESKPTLLEIPMIEYISYGGGETQRITTDLNSYDGVSLTADSATLATVQEKAVFDIWVAPIADSGGAKPITSGGVSGRGTWSPDGEILFDKGEGRAGTNVWRMRSDGTNPKQLTFDTRISEGARISSDNHYVVFVSNRTGTPHIWRLDKDGSNLKQLTDSPLDILLCCSGLDFTPDSKWVLYSKDGPDWGIWKVSIEGRDPIRVNDTVYARYPSVSPDGKMLGYVYDQSGRNAIAVMPLDRTAAEKHFDIITQNLRWTPDSRSTLYIKNEGGVSNIWSQPISGEVPKQITHFTSELIRSFDLSRDGKQLVMERGTANRDVVLIRDVR